MGKKVNPYSFRLGITTSWKSRWYAKGMKYVNDLNQDLKIKSLIRGNLKNAGIADVHIERYADRISVTIFTSRPGVIIGRQGSSLDILKKKLSVLVQSRNLDIKVEEIRKPEIVASLVGNMIANQIERRFPYRRSCKQAIAKAMESGVKGCKIRVSGRLNGAEIARSEVFSEGRIPLQTLRANIEYHSEAAFTTYGKIGIKVWIYKGDVFADKKKLKAMRREEATVISEKKVEEKNDNLNIKKKNIDSVVEI